MYESAPSALLNLTANKNKKIGQNRHQIVTQSVKQHRCAQISLFFYYGSNIIRPGESSLRYPILFAP